VKVAPMVVACALLWSTPIAAQESSPCRFLCAPEFKVEPTVTFGNLFGSPRIQDELGTTTREPRDTAFEVILSLGLPTRASWLEFTVEGIFLPFDRESTPELEFETNFIWLSAERTRGWVSSHADIVDKFSAAERPLDRRAYTHKLNLELDTSVAIFNWLREGRWLRGVELEGSLDYVATGRPKSGDRVDGVRFVDRASPWSFSVVFVLPVAPL
jgi:hypothetical protein